MSTAAPERVAGVPSSPPNASRLAVPVSGSAEQTARHGVTAVLHTLPDDYRVQHDIEIAAFHAGVDHVVIGPTGIFAIVFVQRDERLRVVERRSRRRSRNDIGRECEATRWQAGAVGSVLQHAVVPIVCVADDVLRMPVVHVGHVVVCRVSALASYIADGPYCLDTTAIRFFGDRSQKYAGHTTGRSLAITVPSHSPVPSESTRGLRRRERTTSQSERRRRSLAWRLFSIAGGAAVFVLALQVVALATNIATKHSPGPSGGSTADVAASTTSDLKPNPLVPAPTRSPESAATLASTSSPDTLIDNTLPLDSSAQNTSTVAPTLAPPSTLAALTDELLPTLSFACPTPGGGWSASAVATKFKADELGYFLWYQVAGGPWTFWGQFKSGSTAPQPLGPIAPSVDVNVRMDRTLHSDSGSAPTMLTFTSPESGC